MPRLIDADALIAEWEKRMVLMAKEANGKHAVYLEAAINALREFPTVEVAPQWIPVTERLPEPFVSVLGYCPDEDPIPAVHECYINGFGQWTSSVVYGMGNVTHWMEMPKPPEDGGDGDGTAGTGAAEADGSAGIEP